MPILQPLVDITLTLEDGQNFSRYPLFSGRPLSPLFSSSEYPDDPLSRSLSLIQGRRRLNRLDRPANIS